MASFEDGVSSYIKGKCIVVVNFPVDAKGHADICCNQCPYYGRSSKSCQINKKIVYYPEKYIGAFCPLEITGEIVGKE